MQRPLLPRASGRIRRPSGLAIAALALFSAWTANAAGPPAASASERTVAQRFLQLTRTAPWQKTAEIRLGFRTHHPQGMRIVGDRFFLSSVEVHNRAEGRGVGHLFEVDFNGRLHRQIRLGEGPMYHPGGIDHDGRWLWIPVAEYRPDSRSLVYRVDPDSLEAQRLFEFPDHLGALVIDRAGRQLVGVSWGSRRFYRWELLPGQDTPQAPETPLMTLNGSHYVDYQDGQGLAGTSWALFSGVSRLNAPDGPSFALGGLELVDLETLRAVHQLPVPLWTGRGQSLLQNPMAVQTTPTGLRFSFLPEDDDSTLYVYEVLVEPPARPAAAAVLRSQATIESPAPASR